MALKVRLMRGWRTRSADWSLYYSLQYAGSVIWNIKHKKRRLVFQFHTGHSSLLEGRERGLPYIILQGQLPEK